MLAGGLPMPFPTISLHESFAHPTSMYLRNLMSMDTEEMIRAQPMDAVVLIGGCDKTVPAQLMGAASANVPAIVLVTGAMLTGSHRGERVGACTDCRRYWARYRADEIDDGEIAAVNSELVASVGHLLGDGHGEHDGAVRRGARHDAAGRRDGAGGARPTACASPRQTGAAAVRLAASRLAPRDILTVEAFENAFRVLMAIGGSTNAIIHLTAIAGRVGIERRPRRARPHGPRDAGAGRPETLRALLHGGPAQGRRPRDGAARARAAAEPRAHAR